jgi:DNA-binding NtrC family response regulator
MRSYLDFLFVTNDAALKGRLTAICDGCGWQFRFAADFDGASSLFDELKFKVILIDVGDESLRGLQILEWIRAHNVFSLLSVFSDNKEGPLIQNALTLGSSGFFSGVICADTNLLRKRLSSALGQFKCEREQGVYSRFVPSMGMEVFWVGRHPRIRYLLDRARIVAHSPAAILIRGAIGSGTEQLAKVVLAESNVKNAIWFASSKMPGGGNKRDFFNLFPAFQNEARVLCLPEVGTLSLELQDVLMHFLLGESWEASGDGAWPDLRVIATTSVDLDYLVRAGKFREDLFTILVQNQMDVPPLCERKDDIPILAGYFLENESISECVRYFSDDALAALQYYDWPENVSELRQVVVAAARATGDAMIRAKDLSALILERSFYVQNTQGDDWFELSYNDAKKMALNKFNREYIFDLLARSNNNLTVAAEIAGMDRSNFKKIVKKYFPED